MWQHRAKLKDKTRRKMDLSTKKKSEKRERRSKKEEE
jgi:hypothetical protein